MIHRENAVNGLCVSNAKPSVKTLEVEERQGERASVAGSVEAGGGQGGGRRGGGWGQGGGRVGGG